MRLLRLIATKFERMVSPLISKVLWPPVGANVVCRHEGKYLVLDTGRSYRFPGGLMNGGEHPSEAAAREFREETGLEAEIGEMICIKTLFDGITALHFFYSASLNDGFESADGNWEGEPVLVSKEELSDEMQEVIEEVEEM